MTSAATHVAASAPGRSVAGQAAVLQQARERARALETLYRHIEATRMDGVPILHPGLAVAAVGFEPDADAAGASGVLVTPWFMNLVWLPLRPEPQAGSAASTEVAPSPPLAVGVTRARLIGHTSFAFIGGGEEPFGPFEACSLFSPMFEFEDQAAALATARAVLQHLREPIAPAESPATPPALPAVGARTGAASAPSRRGFLLGSAAR